MISLAEAERRCSIFSPEREEWKFLELLTSEKCFFCSEKSSSFSPISTFASAAAAADGWTRWFPGTLFSSSFLREFVCLSSHTFFPKASICIWMPRRDESNIFPLGWLWVRLLLNSYGHQTLFTLGGGGGFCRIRSREDWGGRFSPCVDSELIMINQFVLLVCVALTILVGPRKRVFFSLSSCLIRVMN